MYTILAKNFHEKLHRLKQDHRSIFIVDSYIQGHLKYNLKMLQANHKVVNILRRYLRSWNKNGLWILALEILSFS